MKRALAILALLAIVTPAYALHQGQTVTLAGQALAGSDTLGNAKITITLVGGSCFTSTDPIMSSSIVFYAAANGTWSKSIIGTDSVSCLGGLAATYSLKIEHAHLTTSGQKIEYNGLTIPATNGATTQLRTILAAQ